MNEKPPSIGRLPSANRASNDSAVTRGAAAAAEAEGSKPVSRKRRKRALASGDHNGTGSERTKSSSHEESTDVEELSMVSKKKKKKTKRSRDACNHGNNDKQHYLPSCEMGAEENSKAKNEEHEVPKQLFQRGDMVYAAWWPDIERTAAPSWYPGRISDYEEILVSGELCILCFVCNSLHGDIMSKSLTQKCM